MTTSLRIGQIPYLNCVLFFHGLEGHPGIRLEPLVPRALSDAAAGGGVDAGPVPLVDTWQIEDRYVPLGDFCISTTERARSVFFFSKRPFDRLDGAEIGITQESSTSVRLLKVLLTHAWRVRPARFANVDREHNDAFLLIGDEALLRRRGVKDFPHMADLGEVWQKWTGLPFVFARWVVRKDIPQVEQDRVGALLDRNLREGWPQLDRIAAAHAANLQMTLDEVRVYLEGFRFRMTAAEHEAIGKFRQLDLAAREAESNVSAEAGSGVKEEIK